jgi:hypothetical protein
MHGMNNIKRSNKLFENVEKLDCFGTPTTKLYA